MSLQYPDRVDLRNKTIFTIDGEDAKDLDDAVFVEKLENGNYLLNVSIADVSHYVTEKSHLNKEAIKRGTSVYLIDRVIPMLPKELSNGICSLNAGEDRLVLSVEAEIDSKGNVIDAKVNKAVIRVTKRMSYTDVKKILVDKDAKTLKKYKDYIENFKAMEELALIIREKREGKGSLDLDLPEAKIIVNEKGKAIDVVQYEMSIANRIIEDFMVTANEVIAEKFHWLEAPFIYRVHEDPEIEKIDELNKYIYNLGYKIKKPKGEVYPKEIAELLKEIKGKPEEKVVSTLVLRTLKQARYAESCIGHFGLASKYYCHFTSPIRRYPDLFIHRIIHKYIESNYNLDEKEIEKYKAQAIEYSKSSSVTERAATEAEREADNIKKAEYMENKIGQEYEGVISSVTSFGMFVELENTVEGLIRFDNMGDDYYFYDEEKKLLIGEHSKKVYKIGDKVQIKVLNASAQTRNIDFEMV